MNKEAISKEIDELIKTLNEYELKVVEFRLLVDYKIKQYNSLL